MAYSPERVKANFVLARLETTPKVVGGLDDASRARVVSLYGKYLGAPIDDVGTIEAAEMTKLLGMLYRDVNIALANELAGFCEVAGVDFERVRAAANSDGEADLLLPGHWRWRPLHARLPLFPDAGIATARADAAHFRGRPRDQRSAAFASARPRRGGVEIARRPARAPAGPGISAGRQGRYVQSGLRLAGRPI